MNIFVTGATGFIASQIVSDLIAAGHSVTCCVRDTNYTKNLFPTATVLSCDFINDTSSSIWGIRLKHMDVVINCVGIFNHPSNKTLWAIHNDSPRALFDACVETSIKKIIQISALGIEQSDTQYAKSKKAADDYLLTLPIPSIIVRPSLVYGRGSYGGTSLFRGMAGLPWITPMPGAGAQELQPIHLEDLSKAILNLIDKELKQSMVLNAVSAKRVTLHDFLTKLRAWLGFSKSKFVFIPLKIMQLGSLFGDLIPYSSFNTTSYKMLIQNNTTSHEETQKFHEQIGFIPDEFAKGIYRHPSSVQDRWHARLYFLKPLLKISIAFIWIFTAVCSLFLYPKTASYDLLAQIGVTNFWQPILFYGASIIDAGLGFAILCTIQPKKIALAQIVMILIYSAILTWKLPNLWFEPFAPLAKNIPLLVAILIFLALESDK